MAEKHVLSLDEQKKLMLGLLDKITRFMDANNLTYELAFGTLLGAIRHKGFIPWDDDVDIMMPLDDYQRMIQILKTEKIADNVAFSCHETNPDHLWVFGKAYDTATKLDELVYLKKYEKRQESLSFGIYIDVFPLYPAPDSPEEREKFEKALGKVYKRMTHASRKVNFGKDPKNTIKSAIYNICFIPDRLLGLDFFLDKYGKLINTYKNEKTNTVCCGIPPRTFFYFDKSLVEKTIAAPFEDLEAKIPAEYDKILTEIYGDYMTPPPENKRYVHQRQVEYR